MSEPVSALTPYLCRGKFGKSGQAGIVMSDICAMQMIQFSAWPDSLNAIGRIAAQVADASTFARPQQMLVGKKARLLRLEPLKWLVVRPDLSSLSIPEIPADQGGVLDVSHARSWLTIKGENAAQLLNHFLPLDLREQSFPVHTMASTAFHHLNANLWREDDGYHLLLPRGFAASLYELLFDSALQYGLEVR